MLGHVVSHFVANHGAVHAGRAVMHAALERPAAGRKAYIREACEGDAALEAALESLLASDDSAGEFPETPAVARVGLPVHPTATLAPGDRLGAYEIVAFLGAGGMGEVYRARDARLERDVALKVLPAQVMNDTVRRQWLTREAGVTVEVETRVTGTVLIPWHGVEGLPSAFASSSNDLSRLPRARSIPVSGVAPGRTAARYAFSRENQQANLYRIRLP